MRLDLSGLTFEDFTADADLNLNCFNLINSGNILPCADNTYDLGSSALSYKDGYFDGTMFLNNNGGTALLVDAGRSRLDGLLETNGGRIVQTTRQTGTPYTIIATDHHVFMNTASQASTVNLPAGVAGTEYRIVNTGGAGNDLTITPNGAELLLGANSDFTLSDGESLIIVFDTNDGWF